MELTDYDHPFWGIADDEGKIDKHLLFNASEGMEDFLQHNKVFVNGLRGTPCHSDSYMTVVDYEALENALAVLDKEFSPTAKDWEFNLNYWLTNYNMQPPLKIVAHTIARRYKVDISEMKVIEKDWSL